MFDRDTELGAASSTWRAFVLRDDVSCGFWCQPDVLRETVGVDGGNLRMETVRKGDSDVALLPFRSSTGSIPFLVGMLRMGKLRASMLKLVDYEFAIQDGTTREEAFGSAVEQIRAQRSCDLVVADNWPLHEHAGDLPLRVTRRHTQATYLIDMPADFDTYFASRSANTRQTLRRRAQGLERKSGCRVSLRVYRKPPEMAALHASLEGVWKNSWHANLGAQAPPTVASLERLSAHGWVRSYVLFADADPIACVQGYQHDGTFYDEAGPD